MTKPPKAAESDDAELFRAAVGEVQPLPEHNRITPKPKPARRQALPHQSAAPICIPDTLSDFVAEAAPREFMRNGIARATLRKIRNGTWPVQNQLDLHGSNTDDARKLLQEFLHEAVQQGVRCVRVIHGKGLNSRGGEGVLRNLARHWLSQHSRVLAYCEAPLAQGGSGAVLVLLKTGS